MIMVFTEKYNKIQRKIINSAIVEHEKDFLPVKALWDTGATGTCISKQLAEKLKLEPIGVTVIQTPSGKATVNKYLINLILNNEVIFKEWEVLDSEIHKQGLDILIGMDIISHGDFAISNFEDKTQFSFRLPSQEHVEYKK